MKKTGFALAFALLTLWGCASDGPTQPGDNAAPEPAFRTRSNRVASTCNLPSCAPGFGGVAGDLRDPVVGPVGGPITLSIPVAASEDDALEDPGGPVLAAFNWVSFTNLSSRAGVHAAGMRFALPVPAGSRIVSASLELYLDSDDEDRADTYMYLEATDDAEPFVEDDFNVTARPRTTAASSWFLWDPPNGADDDGDGVVDEDPAEDLDEGPATTPSLAEPLQEVVDRPGWQAGQHVAVLAFEYGNQRFEWRQWDHSGGAFAPILHVTYEPPVE